MKIARLAAMVVLTLLPLVSAAQDNSRFISVDIYIDSPEPFAAWQFELADAGTSGMVVVGVENGASGAFDRAPYYDRQAVQTGTADRVMVAAYSLADVGDLPSGRVRIATLHLMVTGADEPRLDLRLVTAVTADGGDADAAISFELPF